MDSLTIDDIIISYLSMF